MEYPCVLIRVHEDGRVEVDKNLFLNYYEELDLSLNGYMTLLMEKEFYTDIYIISSQAGVVQCYLEGFLFGRNVDYVSRKNISNSMEYKQIIETSFNKLILKEDE